jgi:thiamine biosynthesis lipoprotein
MTSRTTFALLVVTLTATAVTATIVPATVVTAAPILNRYEFTQTEMGMPFRIILYAPDETTANAAVKAAWQRIHHLNGVMSDYDPQSELSRLSQTAGSGKAVHVSADLWRVLSFAQKLAIRSEGGFDVTVGPLVKLWRRARRGKELPSPERLAEARAAIGYQHLRMIDADRTVELLRPNMRLDLGGIAAGYAVDEALAVLRKHGVTSALVDASGDIGVSNAPPDAAGWKIGIAPLAPDKPASRYLLLTNAAITTSGDAFQHVEFKGVRYSHIVDPHTGFGLINRSSVSVVARDCITADSYATAVSVLGPKRGLELIEETPAAAVLIVQATDTPGGTTLESIESKRLESFDAK